MTFIHQVMLYFCTAVCVLYLLSGGYRAVRDFWCRQIDKRAAEKISEPPRKSWRLNSLRKR